VNFLLCDECFAKRANREEKSCSHGANGGTCVGCRRSAPRLHCLGSMDEAVVAAAMPKPLPAGTLQGIMREVDAETDLLIDRAFATNSSTVSASPTFEPPTYERLREVADEVERQIKLHGTPPVRLLAGFDVLGKLMRLPHADGVAVGPLKPLAGLPVVPSGELAADEWAPVFRTRRKSA